MLKPSYKGDQSVFHFPCTRWMARCTSLFLCQNCICAQVAYNLCSPTPQIIQRFLREPRHGRTAVSARQRFFRNSWRASQVYHCERYAVIAGFLPHFTATAVGTFLLVTGSERIQFVLFGMVPRKKRPF